MTDRKSKLYSIVNSDIILKAITRHDFKVAATVRIPASRSDDDWLLRVNEA